MTLKIDTTWNKKKNRVLVIIKFAQEPKNLFSMPQDQTEVCIKFSTEAPQLGPPALDELRNIYTKYPKSLFAAFKYYHTLEFFEYQEEAREVFLKMKKQFPTQVLTKCIEAIPLINEKRFSEFQDLFQKIEVLKGAFPRRKVFYFEEALLFHNLWAKYYIETGDESRYQNHAKFISLILNTLNSI